MMRYLSICSGIEAATVAWHPFGWTPAAFAEIDAFPSVVLAERWPGVPNLGDFTRIEASDVGAIDVLVGGTPCQSFSIAGLRGGLADDRGNLALEFLRLAQRTRPRWLVWENVPGVLSSNGGRDFGAILGGMVELGYGFAYRVLDAQYFGLAQRRKRVFVVGYLGDWRRAAAVLFERESLSGHPAPRRTARQDVAGTLGARASAGGGLGTDFELGGGLQISHSLNAKGGSGRIDGEGETFVAHTLTAARGAACSHDPTIETFIVHALRADGFDASEDGTGRGTPLVAVPILEVGKGSSSRGAGPNGCGIGRDGDPMFTLQAGAQHAIAFDCKASGRNGFGVGDIAPTLRAMGHADSHQNAGGQIAVGSAFGVRRLTPRECERLQGFPEIRNCFIIRVCRDLSDQQKANALADLQCRRSLSSASPVGESALARFANAADEHSNTLLHVLASRAGVSAQIDSERGAVRLLSAEKSHSSVEGADERNLFPLPTGIGNFARLAVLLTHAWETATRIGRTGSPESTTLSIPAWIGNGIALVSGHEIEERANDAAASLSIARTLSTSTTLAAGSISQNFASTLETLSCCVAHAIAGFIPQTIQEARFFDIALASSCGYTRIPWRGKPADLCPDGPRYRALGNSMAVPVMRWIGERIAAADAFELFGDEVPEVAA